MFFSFVGDYAQGVAKTAPPLAHEPLDKRVANFH